MTRWTTEEKAKLIELMGTGTYKHVAGELSRLTGVKRSAAAVSVQAAKMGLSNKEKSGVYTVSSLANLLNISRVTVRNWVVRKGLPLTKRLGRRSLIVVSEHNKKFLYWVLRNEELFYGLDYVALLCLVGDVYRDKALEWSKKKRIKDAIRVYCKETNKTYDSINDIRRDPNIFVSFSAVLHAYHKRTDKTFTAGGYTFVAI